MLERGEVANSWRRERWDSLRLLTPNWQSRLPGYRYDGADPDGYMTMGEVVDVHLALRRRVRARRCARTPPSPRCRRTDAGYHVATSNGDLRCRTVVLASGACNVPSVPALRQARAGVDPVLHAVRLPQSRRSCRKAACSSSARRPPACSSPTKSTAPAGR